MGDFDRGELSRRSFLTRVGQAAFAMGLVRSAPPIFGRPLSPDGFLYPVGQAGAASGQTSKLIIRSENPQDFETPIELLNTWITPNDLFYVRSHLYTAKVDIKEWRLQVDGAVQQQLTLTLDDLKRFPESSQVVTLECSGNGRAFYDPPVAGAQWEKGAVGNARWVGVRLADVLKKAGIKAEGKFLTTDGADKPIGKVPDFIRSIPLDKAMHADTLLAYQMNGEPIPVSHGYPLRLIVPGWSGNNSVKWVTHLTLSDSPSDGFFQKTAYKFPERYVAPAGSIDPSLMKSITNLSVKSSITNPLPGSQLKPGAVAVTGIAYAGEADIVAVDVSTDLGQTWKPAELGRDRARYAWRLWQYQWEAKEPGSFLIMSRAKDSSGRVQPMVQNWNPSGYLWNVVDKVRVNVTA
ncbi:MAG TPA: sulfite oxidase [Blastocatellia bacterium]|nr:sulfite oxidase [Blastocatellia bacterium]